MQIFSKLADSNPNLKKLSLLLLYLLPLGALVGLVMSLGVNVPVSDQWLLVPYFEKVDAGNVSFLDLFEQHNEHRILLPRIIFSTLAFATNWNTLSEMAVSIIIAVVSFLAIFWISLKTVGNHLIQKPSIQSEISYSSLFHIINFFSCCLLFSWVQYENWLWGFQIPWFLINACLILAILVLQQANISVKLRLTGGATLCLVASASSAHGLFVWLALIPSVIAISGSTKQKIARLMVWGLMFLASLSVYLIGYQTPPNTSKYYLASIGDYIVYFLVSIGVPLLGNHPLLGNFSLPSRHLDIVIISIAGALIFCLFLLSALYVLWSEIISKTSLKERSHLLIVSTAPWFSLGVYSILFSLVNSYGRSGRSIAQALSSRYTTPDILILIALLQIVAILIQYWQVPLKRKIVFGIFALFCIFQIKTSVEAIQTEAYGPYDMGVRRRNSLCSELVNYVNEPYLMKCLENSTGANKERILKLNRLGFIKSPKDVAFVDASNLLNSDEPLSGLPLVSNTHLDIQNASISGKIILSEAPNLSSQPRAVLFAVDNEKTFSAVANLDWNAANRRNELLWQTELMQETAEDIIANDQALKLYLYYPEQIKFVHMDVEILIDNKNQVKDKVS